MSRALCPECGSLTGLHHRNCPLVLEFISSLQSEKPTMPATTMAEAEAIAKRGRGAARLNHDMRRERIATAVLPAVYTEADEDVTLYQIACSAVELADALIEALDAPKGA